MSEIVEHGGGGTRGGLLRASRLGVSEPLTLERLGPLFAGWVLPFMLVLYLALKGGGYDTVVYSEVGIGVWWLVLLGSLIGILPAARISRMGWVSLGLLAAFTAWTALGIGWSQSAERSVADVGRIATYLGVFALALLVQGRDGLRRTVNAVGAGIAVVAALALLSRLHPSWFPDSATRLIPGAEARLAYPLNYWNGDAALIAMGMPLMVFAAIRSRTLWGRALAAASLPALALAAFYTFSRGGAIEIAVGLIVLAVLYPRRLELLPAFVVGGVGSAVLIAGATQRDALESGLLNGAAHSQGDEMLAMTLVVCAGVGLLFVAIGLAAQHGLGPRLTVTRRAAAWALAVVAAAAIGVSVAAGVPGKLSNDWQTFKQPLGPTSQGAARFDSATGNGRYQYWRSAVDANATDPLKGIGPGTYEYWWAQHGTVPGFIRNAHSLYLETLAELGIVGLALILAFVLTPLVAGARRALQSTGDARARFAAATAAGAAFAVAAGIDWAWQLAVIPAAFLLLAAAILGPSIRDRGAPTDRPASARSSPLFGRLMLAAVALASLIAIAIPLASVSSIQASQKDVRASRPGPALDRARTAANIQPYAATPALQQALVLELQGNLGAAVADARAATRAESTNWRTWLVLSRLEAEAGNAPQAVAAYRQARSLNPRSILFR